ncbi:MAG: DUF1738 domain-containing protein [Bacteroidetes bacterium]|nr:DUF1738 domain-containing protein [Bacteroidota bacterium]
MDSAQSIPKLDLYQAVTDRIIALLEQGIIPWQKPWREAGMPKNLITMRPYSGINLWLLLSLNYERNLFLTWEQLKGIGGSVLKDEHGHMVVFWKQVEKKPQERDEQGKPKTTAMLRYIKVFNIAQCKDIPEHLIPVVDTAVEFSPLEACEQIITGFVDKPVIQHKETRAYYDLSNDLINMPKKKSFKAVEGYYSTLFHELVHSTGAPKRLDRKTIVDMAPFGSESYAMEELVAEMGAAYLCQLSGILSPEINNTVAYLDNWLGVFKKDKRFLITAASMAEKSVIYILNKNSKKAIQKN